MTPRPVHTNRAVWWSLVGLTGAMLMLHAIGWIATASVFWEQATLHLPRIQSAIVIGFGLLVLRATAAPRRWRRLVVLCVLVAVAVAFVAAPLPKQFNLPAAQGESLMPSGSDAGRSRGEFENRFRVWQGDVQFHSHLADVAITALDGAFGRSATSPARAYDALSTLAGLLFLLELGIAAAWHRWSRQSCRYVGLALATPLCLLFFGQWDLGYLTVAVGVVPLLALAKGRMPVPANAAGLVAGALQGLHTAFHGFGLLGMASGALAALGPPGTALRRCLSGATFTSAAVALYLGWIFLYVTFGRLSLVWEREVGYRPFFESTVFEGKLATPLFSQAGLGEFGLFSALAGVPLLALAMLWTRRTMQVPTMLYALPGLVFIVRWWPTSAPFNLDLLLSIFPGVFAACWVLAASSRKSMQALVMLVGLHVLLWTTVGTGIFARLEVTP
ncbi:MAG: hypothetical protein O2930_10030 [Acidobacteria bacterium]|nr:hypothetical protein [Acidobacteriota bacterium]